MKFEAQNSEFRALSLKLGAPSINLRVLIYNSQALSRSGVEKWFC